MLSFKLHFEEKKIGQFTDKWQWYNVADVPNTFTIIDCTKNADGIRVLLNNFRNKGDYVNVVLSCEYDVNIELISEVR